MQKQEAQSTMLPMMTRRLTCNWSHHIQQLTFFYFGTKGNKNNYLKNIFSSAFSPILLWNRTLKRKWLKRKQVKYVKSVPKLIFFFLTFELLSLWNVNGRLWCSTWKLIIEKKEGEEENLFPELGCRKAKRTFMNELSGNNNSNEKT